MIFRGWADTGAMTRNIDNLSSYWILKAKEILDARTVKGTRVLRTVLCTPYFTAHQLPLCMAVGGFLWLASLVL